MNRHSLPLRIPIIYRIPIIVTLGLCAWATASWTVLSSAPAETLWLSQTLVLINGACFLALAILGSRLLIGNKMIWLINNRDWRFWILLTIAHLATLWLVNVAEVPADHAAFVALMVVNLASLAVRFSAWATISFNLVIAFLFAAQFDGADQWLIGVHCAIQQLVLWSFGLSMVAEMGEVRRLRETQDELRMAQTQITESGRMLERRQLRHNLHDKMGHELATLHLNLQILEQQTRRQSLTELVSQPLEQSRAACRRMFSELNEIVTGLRTIPASGFYDALTQLIDQASLLDVDLHWDDKVRIADPQACEVVLSATREFLTNVMKHSSGRMVTLRSMYSNATFTIWMTDHAVCEKEIIFGNGLSGVAERIRALGGEFNVLTEANQLSWCIRLPEVPL